MPKPRKKRGPREERLVITEDPAKALRRLLGVPAESAEGAASCEKEAPAPDAPEEQKD